MRVVPVVGRRRCRTSNTGSFSKGSAFGFTLLRRADFDVRPSVLILSCCWAQKPRLCWTECLLCGDGRHKLIWIGIMCCSSVRLVVRRRCINGGETCLGSG